MDKLSMGDRIREVRRRLSMTQEQLAEKLDVTVTYISELERNLKLPSMGLFVKLIEVLDVSADYLLRDNVSSLNLYGDSVTVKRLERLTPKQKLALQALIDAYIAYL